jgi:hypothetical protein
MVKGVANVWVPVKGIQRALDFYQNTLEFSVIKRDGPWAEIDADGINIGLNCRQPAGARAGGWARGGGRGAQGQRGRVPEADLRARVGACCHVQ